MYTLWIRNTNDSTFEEMCIYNDESTFEEFKIISASLTLEEDSAGSLDLKVPITNVGYEYFEILATEIKIVKNGAVYWIGRLLSSSEDWDANLALKFEGSYNYLMDTVVLQNTLNCYPTEWLKFVLDTHNASSAANTEYWKVIQLGYVDTSIDTGAQTDFYSDYETALDLTNNVIEGWSMHPVFTYTLANHFIYTDRVTDPDHPTDIRINYDGTTGTPADPYSVPKFWNLEINIYKNYLTYGDRTPTITFGENLEDYTKENSVTELATVIVPKGGAYDDEEKATIVASLTTDDPLEGSAPIEGLDYYCTVWHANNHSEYVVTNDTAMLNRFGVVCKVVEFNDCTDPAELLVLAQNYLQNQKWIGTNITIKAIDASLLGLDVEQVKIGVGVKCYSEPHELDYTYPCTGITEDLLDPSATNFTLGIKDNSYMSDASRRADDELKKLIIKNRQRENVLRSNADKDIKDAFSNRAIWEPSTLYEYFTNEIETGIEQAESVATGDAKKYALNLLNIYDQDANPYNKGYVHFKKAEDPYGGDKLSIPALKQRIIAALPQVVNDQYWNTLWTIVDQAFDSTEYTITVLLGSNNVQNAIYVTGRYPQPIGTNIPYIDEAKGYYSYEHPNVIRYKYDIWAAFVSVSSSQYSIYANLTNLYQVWGPENGFSTPTTVFTNYSAGMNLVNYVYPNKATLDKNGVEGYYKVYVSNTIKTSSTNTAPYFNKNLYKTSGEVPITYDDHICEICISDNKDYTTGNVWRWNKTGLYFIQQGYYNTYENYNIPDPGSTGYQTQDNHLRIGITSDGSIVADRITAGRLDAGIIRAGYLCSQDFDPADYDHPWDSASFVLDVEHGTILAKTGALIFNCTTELDGSLGNRKGGQTNFVYLSNLTTGERTNGKGYMEVSGQEGNEWLFILGSNFGVDAYGRVFMREGIIGATGGIWNLKYFNSEFVNFQWVASGTSGVVKLQYKLTLNTTGYRPMGCQVKPADYYDTSKEQFICRWRLARYGSNNSLIFLSSLFNMSPEAGNGEYRYDWQDTNVTYTGTAEQAAEYYADIFYRGSMFPVYYILDDSAQDPDYTQDGHGFHLIQGGLIKITGKTNDNPQYTSWSDGRYVPNVGQRTDAVHVGSGYIYNGDIGTNSSFSLSAINRTATLAVPNGSGSNTTTRDDWRLTVGSKFGVTDDGTLHCAGAYLRNAIVDSSISASYVNTNNVGGVKINSTQDLDGSTITYTINVESDWTSAVYYAGPAWLQVYVTAGKTYDSNTQEEDPIDPVTVSGHQYIPQTAFYDDIEFHVEVAAEFVYNSDVSVHETSRVYENSFTFSKNTQTYMDKYVVQEFSMGDAHGWATPPSSAWSFHCFNVEVHMGNEKIDSTPTWQMTSWAQETYAARMGKDHSFSGQMTVVKGIANEPRTVMDVGSRDLVSNSRWLGGPNKIWGRSYINAMHYHEAISGLSSRVYKNSIVSLPDIYDKLFDDLRPVSFFYNKAERHVRHTGFIMEEVGDAMTKNGISPVDFGAYSPNIGGAGGELCYMDFIALNTRQIQKLKERIRELEERLDEVERNENSSNT